MSQQSYGHYAPSGAQTPPPASAAYPYGAYPAAYPPHTPYAQTPGTYPYQAAGPYQYTAWKYAYPYPQQPQTPAAQPRPAPVSPSSQYPNFYPESSAEIEHIFLVYAVALAGKCSCCRNRWCNRSRCSEAIEFAGFVHKRMYVRSASLNGPQFTDHP